MNSFLARLDEVQEEYCATPSVGIGVGGGGVSKKFNIKVFYVMGKVLSGELSCPCDRSCFRQYFRPSSRGREKKKERKNNQTAPFYLLQAQWALVLLLFKLVGCPGISETVLKSYLL